MSSIADPSRLKKVYIKPSSAKSYPGKLKLVGSKKGPIIILPAPPQTKPLESIDCSHPTDSQRENTTIDMSEIMLFRDLPSKPWDNGKQPIHNSSSQNISKEIEQKNANSDIASTEVIWLPTASQKGDKVLVLENENIETMHSENESDEDGYSVSDQSGSENEYETEMPLNSSGETQNTYNSINTTPRKNIDEVLNPRSEKLNQSHSRKSFNPNDILKQLKAINSTQISKPGVYTTVSKREYCQEWLKHQALPGFEQDQKLFNFLASKLKPSIALESRESLKNLVSSHFFQLSYMWTESGKNKDKMYKEYSNWFNGPPIKLTSSRPIDIQPTSNIPDELVRNNIETNADAFKFLKNFDPPFIADGLIRLVPCTDLTPEKKAKLHDFCARYVADMKFKWLTSNDNEGVFFKKFECWLKLNVKWPVFLKDVFPIPKKTAENEEFNIFSNISEDLVTKMMLNRKIDTIEKILVSKYLETGKDISKIIHRVIHHPEDAALVAGIISDDKECSCYPQLAGIKIPNKDGVKKFKPPSQAQKEVLKMTVERLKDSMPPPKDPLKEEDPTASPIQNEHAAPAEAHQAMLNQHLYRIKFAKLPLQNTIPIRKEVNQVEIISKVNIPHINDDEDDGIETCQPNEGGDKIVKGGVFKFKAVSPPKTIKQRYQPTNCPYTPISTVKESFHNSNEKMIVDTAIDNNNTIDSYNNFVTPTEQNHEKNNENLEFGPVLDKLIFTQPLNLPKGAIIKLPNNKEAILCNVSNCSATVLIPKFVKKSGPDVRVKKSNYNVKTLVKRIIHKKNTSTVKKASSIKNHGLQDSPKRSQECLVQMQPAFRKVSELGHTKRKEEIIASIRASPSSAHA